eukprot:10777744-Lingulodinium_polyedra.AAC.1
MHSASPLPTPSPGRLCVVLPAALQDEEDQRAASARYGSDAPTNVLHAWLAIGRPICLSLTF